MLDNDIDIIYTEYIPMKDKLLTVKMDLKEKQALKNLAKEEGHETVAGFLKWLIHQFKTGKLVRKR